MQKHHMAETASNASDDEIYLDDLQIGLAELEDVLRVASVAAGSAEGASVASDIGTVIRVVCGRLASFQKDLGAAIVADYQVSDLFDNYEETRKLYEQETRDGLDHETPVVRKLNAAETAFLSYRPVTRCGAHQKAEKILNDPALFSSLLEERDLRLFLSSLTYGGGGVLQ